MGPQETSSSQDQESRAPEDPPYPPPSGLNGGRKIRAQFPWFWPMRVPARGAQRRNPTSRGLQGAGGLQGSLGSSAGNLWSTHGGQGKRGVPGPRDCSGPKRAAPPWRGQGVLALCPLHGYSHPQTAACTSGTLQRGSLAPLMWAGSSPQRCPLGAAQTASQRRPSEGFSPKGFLLPCVPAFPDWPFPKIFHWTFVRPHKRGRGTATL